MSLYKGLLASHLEFQFGVRFRSTDAYVVPYRDVAGTPYREKEFSRAGKSTQWLGERKPQIPYGVETLSLGGRAAFLTEGESCAWWLRVNFPDTPVLGIPGASSWQTEWRRLLATFPVIYLSFDNDRAGIELTDAVWPDLPWARRVKLPENTDTRDVLELEGVAAYERLLDEADYIAGCTRFILETPARIGELHAAV